MTKQPLASRRQFLAATALVAGVGLLVLKPDKGCTKAPQCGSCSLFNGCDLPQAKSARQQNSGTGGPPVNSPMLGMR